VPDFPYARYAELLGLRGLRVDRAEQVGSVWDEALTAACPVVLEAIVDADVPTLPPDLQPEHKEKLARALSAGDSQADGVRRQLALEGYSI
jgi:pyruvate dehydrogenase (quinone)